MTDTIFGAFNAELYPESQKESGYISPIIKIQDEIRIRSNLSAPLQINEDEESYCTCQQWSSGYDICMTCGKKQPIERFYYTNEQATQEPMHAQALLRASPQYRYIDEDILIQTNHLLHFMRADVKLHDPQEHMTNTSRQKQNIKAANELVSLLTTLSHEMKLEEYGNIENKVFKSIFSLVHSQNIHEKMAGIAALDAVLDAPSADEEKKTIKFANALSNSLRVAKGNFEFLSEVCKALGHMATQASNVDFVEAEIMRALEWLRTGRSDRRLAACLLLKEFAINTPTTFHSKTSQTIHGQGGSNEFLDHLFEAIRDPQPIVRACAADTLSQTLKILVQRKHVSLTGLLCQVYKNTIQGLQQDHSKRPWRVESETQALQHGSLLVVSTLLVFTGKFVLPRFENLCRAVLDFTGHEKPLIRLEVIKLIPRLAFQYPKVFGRRYLEEGLDFLIECASTTPKQRSIDTRPSAFRAIGRLVVAMRDPSSGHIIGSSSLPVLQLSDEKDESGRLKIKLKQEGILSERLDKVFVLLRQALDSPHLSQDALSSILFCASDLIASLGNITFLDSLIEEMFSTGLSHELIHCLHWIGESVPQRKGEIEEKMLQEVSLSLAGLRNIYNSSATGESAPAGRLLKAANRRRRGASIAETANLHISINHSSDDETVRSLVLSLQTLASFAGKRGGGPTGTSLYLLPFLRDVVARYLFHPSAHVRRAASLTCCSTLIPRQAGEVPLNSHSGTMVEEVLLLLLKVSVSDSSAIVRLGIVRALDSRYDPFLVQTKQISELFLLLQDETLATRSAGLRLLGRLATENPAPVLPYLRRYVGNLLNELQCGVDNARGTEEAVRLLTVFLRSKSLKRLVDPLLPAIVSALPVEGNTTPRLVTASLEALGDLAHMTGSSLKPWVGQIIPRVLEVMQDQSSATKQQISLRTLGQIAGSTGYVIKPYLDYPDLLSRATDVLPATKHAPWALRREVIRTLGILGALDPDRYSSIAWRGRKAGVTGGAYFDESSQSSSSRALPNGAGERSETLADMIFGDDDQPAYMYMYEHYTMIAEPVAKSKPRKRITPKDEEFYATVVMQGLMRVFSDPALVVHHSMVIQAIMFIFKSLGRSSSQYLTLVMPQLLMTLRTGSFNLRETLFKQLAVLSVIVREHLRDYVFEIFDIVELFWETQHLSTIFGLLSNIAAGTPEEFEKFVPRLTRRILSTIGEIQVSDWSGRADVLGPQPKDEALKLALLLKGIGSLKNSLTGHLHVLIPALLGLGDSMATLSRSRTSAISDSTEIELFVLIYRTLSNLLESQMTQTSSLAFDFYNGMGTNSKKPSESALASRVVQPVVRILHDKPPKTPTVGLVMIETLCICARLMGGDKWAKIYDSTVRNAITSWQATFPMTHDHDGRSSSVRLDGRLVTCLEIYDEVVEELVEPSTRRPRKDSFHFGILQRTNSITDIEGNYIQAEEFSGLGGIAFDVANESLFPSTNPLLGVHPRKEVNQSNLQRAWEVSQVVSRDDWEEWMRRLAIQLLREAPDPSLRAASSLAQAYQPLARELFSAAFACCWKELSAPYRANLVQALEVAFRSDVPPEILQALLNLAEFMEHDSERGLPIEISRLGELALKCRAYAKALYYREKEYTTEGPSSWRVESLISINRKLDLQEAALGILRASTLDGLDKIHSKKKKTFVRNFGSKSYEMNYSVTYATEERRPLVGDQTDLYANEELWLTKLGNWTDALELYQRRLRDDSTDFEAMLGCMRCLDASGGWSQVLHLADQYSLSLSRINETADRERSRRKANRFCAEAAWRLGQWDELDHYATHISKDVPQTTSNEDTAAKNESQGTTDFDASFYNAVSKIHRKEWDLAANEIDHARKAMDGRLTALMSESYKRAYPSMVTAQTLAEMEEIIEYLKLEESSQSTIADHHEVRKARKRLISVWNDRLAGCRVDANVHSSILRVRSLVLTPEEQIDAILKLSELSRQARRFKFAERVLLDPLKELRVELDSQTFGFNLADDLGFNSDLYGNPGESSSSGVITKILGGDLLDILPKYGPDHEQLSKMIVVESGGMEKLQIQHRLYYTFLKHLWSTERKDEALSRLSRFCNVVDMISECESVKDSRMQISCWLQLGEWKLQTKEALQDSKSDTSTQVEVLAAFRRATMKENCGYRAWHDWALMNFRIAQEKVDTEQQVNSSVRTRTNVIRTVDKPIRDHIIAAVESFAKAIRVGTKKYSASVQQDLLNFLTCLFRFGTISDVNRAMKECVEEVAIEAWLGVLPQLLARIQIKEPGIRSILHPLLIQLGQKHPQAMMYPLSVLEKSPVTERKIAAESLLNSLKAHSSGLVEEAQMVSTELIRLAIMWLETWQEGLEVASRYKYRDENVAGMLDLLFPLHDKLEEGAETKHERDFVSLFGNDLKRARQHLDEYVRLMKEAGAPIPSNANTGDRNRREVEEAEVEITRAWNIYYTVFRSINKQLPSMTSLDLAHCSPLLSKARGLELGVPGSYQVDGSFVKIDRFVPEIEIITSKQRPRKIQIRGNDGNEYQFLLKGHEDLRQDERVMQLFGTVNALLARDPTTRKHDLNIRRYAISPLSHNCGLVGWVPHCETLHSLIREYRESKKVPLNMETREMNKITPEYDMLPVLQKVEVFIEALKRTTGNGNDLAQILWLRSANSEEWLDRRTNYTRSLAVMSMVGYILGLGDRHPSNSAILLDGRVLHIDFGDCFEVAVYRDRYPERVPFRLTRMLIKAMEVSGIEGSYRSTCERTMGVLRESRDSLVAMLEAFVHDPLISWRLEGLSPSEGSSKAEQQADRDDLGSGVPIEVSTTTQEDEEKDSNDELDDSVGALSTGISSVRNRRSVRNAAMSASRAQAMQLHLNIQKMAANADARIASITSGQAPINGSRIERSMRQREIELSRMTSQGLQVDDEALNENALRVVKRIQDKLTGTDFPELDSEPLAVEEQVQRLIVQATSTENLAQLFVGWCAFW